MGEDKFTQYMSGMMSGEMGMAWWNGLLRFLGVTCGALIVALGLNMFLVPHKIAAGGTSGIAIILHYVFDLPVGMTMLVLDLPLFALAVYRLGFLFGLRSLYGSVILAAAVDLLAPITPEPTADPLLACLFGGVLVGLGLGVVFRSRGTTGGTDLAAAVIRTYTGVNLGQLLFLLDGAVVVAAGMVFHSWELALYALITIFITSRVIDVVQEGFSYTKAFFIISRHPEAIAQRILHDLDRGGTALQARGLYHNVDREVIFTVVNRAEVGRLKAIVHSVDPRAFVVVTDAREVLGEGFKEYRNGED